MILVFTIKVTQEPTIFLESLIGKQTENIVAAKIAQFYTQVLPLAEYQGLGINLTGVVTFPDQPQSAQSYLSKNLIVSGNWLDFGVQPAKIDLNISYTLEQGNLNLQISQIEIPQEGQEATIPAVRFFGNFDYAWQQIPVEERLGALHNVLAQWQVHVEMFTSLINERFLNGTNLFLQDSNYSLTGGGY